MNQIDTNIANYTIPELLTILDIQNTDIDEETIRQKTDSYIEKYTKERNSTMITFFSDMKNRLLAYLDKLNGENSTDEPDEADVWYKRNNLLQLDSPNQLDKNTDREQKVQVFTDTNHDPMKREQIGINNTFSVPVVQDSLNPTLKNTITRMINIDSQFRQTSAGANDISTDFTLDLSEPLTNVLSLKLHAFMIPYTWYTIDVAYGNNCMWLTFEKGGPSISVSLTPGNYTPTTFQTELNAAFVSAGIQCPNQPVTINPINGILTLNLYGGTYQGHTINETTVITFFDPTSTLTCGAYTVCKNTVSVNQTLGWIMGFRVTKTNVLASGNTAIAIVDLYGPKYLILVLDDFNQNHINNGLVGITEVSTTLKMPSYFSPDMLYTCLPPSVNGTNLDKNNAELANDPNAANLIIDKLNISYKPTVQVLPSGPRTLTQSQLYSINEIMKNNGKSMSLRGAAPTISNTFAIIPMKTNGLALGQVYVESNGSLQDNKRVYFGPVNIERMRVRLLDDKGNILNLNGCDWSITLVSENLYQY